MSSPCWPSASSPGGHSKPPRQVRPDDRVRRSLAYGVLAVNNRFVALWARKDEASRFCQALSPSRVGLCSCPLGPVQGLLWSPQFYRRRNRLSKGGDLPEAVRQGMGQNGDHSRVLLLPLPPQSLPAQGCVSAMDGWATWARAKRSLHYLRSLD